MDCSSLGSSVHGLFQARILEWIVISFSRGSSDPGIELGCPALQADSLPTELWGKASVRVSDIKYIHIAVCTLLCDHHHHPFPEFFSSCKTESLYPLNNNTPSPLFPSPGNNHSFCLYEFDCPKYLIGEGNGTPLQYSCLENPMDGGAWKAAVHGVPEGRTRLSDFNFTFHFHALEKEMATHSSILAYRIPGTGEPGGLLSMGSHRVGHDWNDLAAVAAASTSYERKRQWHPTPVLLPGKSHGWRSLVGCSLRGCKESGTTERLHFHFSLSCTGEGNGNPLQCSCLENPRDGEPGGLQSMGSHRVGHDWSDLAAAASTSYERNHTIFVLLWLVYYTWCLQDSSVLQIVSKFLSFLRLNNIPSYTHTSHFAGLFIHLCTLSSLSSFDYSELCCY